MRFFLIGANLLAMLGLFFLLREEWNRITDYLAALVIFGGGISLTALNIAYIQATPAHRPAWLDKARQAWAVLRS